MIFCVATPVLVVTFIICLIFIGGAYTGSKLSEPNNLRLEREAKRIQNELDSIKKCTDNEFKKQKDAKFKYYYSKH